MDAIVGDEKGCSFSDHGRFECNCDKKTYTLKGKILNGVLMAIMVGIGLFILIQGLVELGEEAAGEAPRNDEWLYAM